MIAAEEVRGLPKAEVHVHLEGCFEQSDVDQLAREAGEPGRSTSTSGMDLATFLELLDWTCGLVRTPSQAARAAYAFAKREAESGVVYADLIVNPTHWSAWRDRLDEFVERRCPRPARQCQRLVASPGPQPERLAAVGGLDRVPPVMDDPGRRP